jgi:hypothetical protein
MSKHPKALRWRFILIFLTVVSPESREPVTKGAWSTPSIGMPTSPKSGRQLGVMDANTDNVNFQDKVRIREAPSGFDL